jgi:hypothetical protein
VLISRVKSLDRNIELVVEIDDELGVEEVVDKTEVT